MAAFSTKNSQSSVQVSQLNLFKLLGFWVTKKSFRSSGIGSEPNSSLL